MSVCPACQPWGPPPGTGKHHPDCPCCAARANIRRACRSVDSMRGARIQDTTIRRLLEREGMPEYAIDEALAWQGENPPMAASYRPTGQS